MLTMRFSQKLLVVATMLVLLSLFSPIADRYTGIDLLDVFLQRKFYPSDLASVFGVFSTLILNIFTILEGHEEKEKSRLLVVLGVSIVVNTICLINFGTEYRPLKIGFTMCMTGLLLSILGWGGFIYQSWTYIVTKWKSSNDK